jgi:glycosyltransferase involved in cell wall biosynthesis
MCNARNDSLKILHVNHLLDPVSGGGTAERTFQLTRFLMKGGADCAVLTLDVGNVASLERKLEGARIFKLACLNERFYIFTEWPFRIRALISEFDVVHLMGHWTLLNAVVALSCMSLGKPYVVCPAGALKSFGRSQWMKRIYEFLIGRRIIRSAKGWVAITEAERVDFTAYGIASDSVVVIPNGVDPEEYVEPAPNAKYPSTKIKELENAPYILFLGRLNAIKGPDLLLEAFITLAERFPNLNLVFAGPDSGLLLTLQSRASQSIVEKRIHFLGYLGGADKVAVLQKALCLVIPSRHEAMSIVVLEAGICGTPVLFTDQCGLDEIATARAGVMVNVSSGAIAQGLVNLFDNPNSLDELGTRLQRLVSAKYLWSAQAARYLQLYDGLLGY